MDRDALIERLMATFLVELGDHVRALNENLLALEADPGAPDTAERYKTLFRAAHSLKGAARSVGVAMIEDACHALEDRLAPARDGRRLDPAAFALLFEAADAIEDAGARLRAGRALDGGPLAAALDRLRRPAPAPAPPAPEVPPLPPPVPSPPPPAAAAPPTPAPRRAAEGPGFVRVPAEKLDALLTWSGEVLVARRRVDAQAADLDALRRTAEGWADRERDDARADARRGRRGSGREAARSVESEVRLRTLAEAIGSLARVMGESRRQLARAAGRLDGEVRRARMVPFAEACEGLERAARDVARAAGKAAELAVSGGAVELDRSVLEWLKDPLLHLVRNAVDHGIEAPGLRAAAGKPAAGRVEVRASLRGDQVEVVVSDDGAGLDPDALRVAARGRGLAEPADDRAAADLIFLPGLSTAPAVTTISGRGIGLDVVKSRIEGLHGSIDVASTPGQGTRFTLTVPLTLTSLRALIVRAGGQVFALASAGVQRLVRVGPDDLRPVGGRPALLLGGAPVPVAELAEALGIADPGATPAPGSYRPAVVAASGDRRVAFLVDELVAEQEILIKGLGARVRRVRHVSGATLLASGRVALVLNAVSLVRAALGRGPGRLAAAAPTGPPPARRRLLVVDDSLTTRTLEKSLLEAAGYEVGVAVDGEDGLRALHDRGADLLISDVEMPRMDGFALTAAVRASPRFAALPVILFSSRASDADKARGNEVGADAYLVKGAFDQKELLETVAQLL